MTDVSLAIRKVGLGTSSQEGSLNLDSPQIDFQIVTWPYLAIYEPRGHIGNKRVSQALREITANIVSGYP